jgi:WD40 repeat protein
VTPHVPTDYASCEVEHILCDEKGKGIAPRSIIYIEDLKYLITGDATGRVIIWDMASKPKPLFVFQEKDYVRCLLSIKPQLSTRYLLVGVSNDIVVYKLNGPVAKAYTTLEGHSSVNHIEFDPESNRLFTCGWDECIRVWSVDDFKLLYEIDVEALKIPSPMATLKYFSDDKTLAIETKRGLSIIKTEQGNHQPKNFFIRDREGYGLTYLKSSNQFVIRVRNTEAWFVDRKTLVKKGESFGELQSDQYPGHNYIPNEDDTQILTNSNSDCLLIYSSKGEDIFSISLSGYISKSSGLQVLGNSRKIVVGDEDSGVILVLKAEAKDVPTSLTKKEKEISAEKA